MIIFSWECLYNQLVGMQRSVFPLVHPWAILSRTWRLRMRLTFISVLFVTLVMMTFGAARIFFNQREIQHNQDERIKNSVTRLSLELQTPIWNWAIKDIQDIFRTELNDPELTAVILISPTEQFWDLGFFRQDSLILPLVSMPQFPGGIRAHEHPVYHDGQYLGKVVVYSNDANMQKQMQNDLAWNLIQTLVIDLILGWVIFIVMKKAMLPLEKLTQASKSLLESRFTQSLFIDIKTNDEIGTLANSFNVLTSQIVSLVAERDQHIEQLNCLYKEVSQVNDELEEKIKSRTKELSQANHELSTSLENLQKTQGQLIESEKMASLGQLVAGVAHEINTPVGVCVSVSTYLATQNDELVKKLTAGKITKSEMMSFLQSLHDSIDIMQHNLQRTVQLVTSFKKIAVNQSSDECQRFLLKEYLQTILLSLRHEYKNRPIEISVECDDDLAIECYPGIISQILTNLIMNSLIHGFPDNEKKGNITIKAWVETGLLTIAYTDNGRGIPGEIMSQIFDPFFTTNRAQGGSGLGLSIVYNLVTQKLKGQIRCSSDLEKETTFTLVFPTERRE